MSNLVPTLVRLHLPVLVAASGEHDGMCTAQIYDRRHNGMSLDEVERI